MKLLITALVAACLPVSSIGEAFAADADREIRATESGSDRPLEGVMFVFLWEHYAPMLLPFHAGPKVCDRVEVAITDADGKAIRPINDRSPPPFIATVHKPGFQQLGSSGSHYVMKPDERPSSERIADVLLTAGGIGCPLQVLRGALPFLISVRDEAVGLSPTANQERSIAGLTATIEKIRSEGDGSRFVTPSGDRK